MQIEGSCMLGLTSREVFSFFNITAENNKVELYKQPIDSEFSFTELKVKLAAALGLSDISIEDLEH